ncbi:MAG TPA: glycoside hydrolase family 18 protein [Terracidiphilus sp.]|nr:glycoside hydrolase family 18 protein [Terracidiphilus sp.]
MRALRAFLFFLACAVLILAPSGAFASAESGAPVIAGYVFPDGASLQPAQIDAHAMTRINYAFANINNGEVVLGYPQDAANLKILTALRQQNPALQILLSVGGWSWSTHFSDAALTGQSRQAFIQSAMDLVDRYELDGLDIDWEYPDQPGAGNVHRREDKQNFTLLLKELRENLDAAAKKLHRRLYLTIAAGGSDEYLQKTEMDKVQNYVDAVNLMAYDYYIPGPDHITGYVAPLFASPADPKHASADASVKAFEKAGVPAAKIVLGVPFYGRAWRDVADQNHGLFQHGKGGPDAYLSYDEIARTMLGHGYKRYWDEASSVPYLYSPDQRLFVSYEDPQSLAAKCRYILENKLGGVIVWNYSDDPSGVLLRTIDRNLSNPEP